MSNSCNHIEELPLKPFGDLKGKTFVIPFQQRGYKWTSSNVEELLDDLREFIENADSKKRVYCLQPLALFRTGENCYAVIDGQQRLTTLYLLYKFLYGFSPYTFEYERDIQAGSDISRQAFLKNIESIENETANQNIDYYYIHNAYQTIGSTFTRWTQERFEKCEAIGYCNFDGIINSFKDAFKTLLEAKKEEKSLQIIWYEVGEDKQHETFQNLNNGKIPLTNTELIKALLLNRVSGLPSEEREEAAATFELIERQLQNDHFWYVFNTGELRNGQSRMDFLFNIVSGTSKEEYDVDSRSSFRKFFSKPAHGSLSEKWKKVRHTYLRLKDMYDDIYCYHYIGFLTYNSNDNTIKATKKFLKLDETLSHSDLIKELKNEIKLVLTRNHSSIRDYTYDGSSKKDLRLLFMIHNIEAILQKYRDLKENECLNLESRFERFPFELFHKQDWDIEHIASNTDSDFTNHEDRDAWLESIKADLGSQYSTIQDVQKLEEEYLKSKNKDTFGRLYKRILQTCDASIPDAISDNPEESNNKMQIGNLTLLDRHTNRSYHNALFPRKRKYIIVANGLIDKADDYEKGISRLYIPPCTLSVFTKSYNKSANVTLNAWTQSDADAYAKDMEQKLSYYFNN